MNSKDQRFTEVPQTVFFSFDNKKELASGESNLICMELWYNLLEMLPLSLAFRRNSNRQTSWNLLVGKWKIGKICAKRLEHDFNMCSNSHFSNRFDIVLLVLCVEFQWKHIISAGFSRKVNPFSDILRKTQVKASMMWIVQKFIFHKMIRIFTIFFGIISVLWNWKVPSGYLYLIGLQFVWLNCALCVVACSLSLFVGCCILFSSLAMDVKERFADLRESVIGSALSVEPLEKLKDIVQFHSVAKE